MALNVTNIYFNGYFMTNSSAVTITIPANSSVAFPMGTEIEVVQTGDGAEFVFVS